MAGFVIPEFYKTVNQHIIEEEKKCYSYILARSADEDSPKCFSMGHNVSNRRKIMKKLNVPKMKDSVEWSGVEHVFVTLQTFFCISAMKTGHGSATLLDL